MVSFRKSLMVLALLALCAGLASAAVTPSCTTNFTPTVLRAEGVTELLNPITITCTDTTSALLDSAAWNVEISTTAANITSAPGHNAGADGEIILTSGSPLEGHPHSTTHGVIDMDRGVVTFDKAVIYNTDVTPVAGTATFSFTISGLRVNASALPQGGPTNAVVVGLRLFAGPTTTSTPVLFGDSPFLSIDTVGYAITSFKFYGSKPTNLPEFKQCYPASANPTADVPSFGTSFTVTFEERYGGAFRKLADENYSDPTNPLLTDNSAANGTRLAVTFADVPGNTTLYVPGYVKTGVVEVSLVTGAKADGSGGTVGGTTGGIKDGANHYWFAVTPGTPVFYEITQEDLQGTPETLVIPVSIGYNGQPALTAAPAVTATGAFAPFSSSILPVNSPITRFSPSAKISDSGFFTITACTTSLLFPYVTTQSGWAVGLAVSNTAANPINSNVTGESGTCAFSFYGDNAPADPVVLGKAGFGDTTEIAPGTTAADGAAKAIGDGVIFTGYAYAVCNFEYAKGYAFIVGNTPSGVISNGYLAPSARVHDNRY